MMKRWVTKEGAIIIRILSLRCNVYLASLEGRSILVDSSVKTERKTLAKRLLTTGVPMPAWLFMTHTHFDHAGNAAWLRRELELQSIVHQSEACWFSQGNTPIPAGSNRFSDALVGLSRKRDLDWFRYEPCPVDLAISANTILPGFGDRISILCTPGHSPGSMTMIVDDEIALTGDTLFSQVPWTIFPPFADDPAKLVESWQSLLQSTCRLFLPAHGSPVTRKRFLEGYESKKHLLTKTVG